MYKDIFSYKLTNILYVIFTKLFLHTHTSTYCLIVRFHYLYVAFLQVVFDPFNILLLFYSFHSNSSTGKRYISNACIGVYRRYHICNEQVFGAVMYRLHYHIALHTYAYTYIPLFICVIYP